MFDEAVGTSKGRNLNDDSRNPLNVLKNPNEIDDDVDSQDQVPDLNMKIQ